VRLRISKELAIWTNIDIARDGLIEHAKKLKLRIDLKRNVVDNRFKTDLKLCGMGGIMFAQFKKSERTEIKSRLADDDESLSAFVEKVQNHVRRNTRQVFLFEETDSSFLISSRPEGVVALYNLSKKIHEIANEYGFRMKIVIHYGYYLSGVSPTALVTVSYFGKPMNEAGRMFDGMDVGQTSLSTEFYMQLYEKANKKTYKKIIYECLCDEFRNPKEIDAKGALNSIAVGGKKIKRLGENKMQRFIVVADPLAKAENGLPQKKKSKSSTGEQLAAPTRSTRPQNKRQRTVHPNAEGKLSAAERAKALKNAPIIYRKFEALAKKRKQRTKSAEKKREGRYRKRKGRTASE